MKMPANIAKKINEAQQRTDKRKEYFLKLKDKFETSEDKSIVALRGFKSDIESEFGRIPLSKCGLRFGGRQLWPIVPRETNRG